MLGNRSLVSSDIAGRRAAWAPSFDTPVALTLPWFLVDRKRREMT